MKYVQIARHFHKQIVEKSRNKVNVQECVFRCSIIKCKKLKFLQKD